MTTEEIVKAAYDAGFSSGEIFQGLAEFKRLIDAAAAAEREACAKLCDNELCDNEKPVNPWKPVSSHQEGQFEMAGHLAERIRSRGQQ
jgi:hypothetical protein